MIIVLRGAFGVHHVGRCIGGCLEHHLEAHWRNMDIGWVMLCISMVGVMQHELGSILRGVSMWLCYPLMC